MKISTFITTTLAIILLSFQAIGQLVSTFATLPSNADVAVDAQGYVYVASESSSVMRIAPTGLVDAAPFCSGQDFSRASGLAFDPTGDTLYVTNRPLNGNGWVTKVHPDGTSEVILTGLNFPGDIAMTPDGSFYLSEFNNTIRKVDPFGNSVVYAVSSLFNTALGIAWTPGDTVFVSSAHDGNIYKLVPGASVSIQWFAHVDGLVQNWACGFMTYGDGHLYITNGDNIIHQIDMQGNVTDYAGTGNSGGTDGAFSTAEFQAPNGIAFNTNDSKLFVTEWGMQRVRLLDKNAVGIEADLKPSPFDLHVYPNPGVSEIIIEFSVTPSAETAVEVFSIDGKLVNTLSCHPMGENSCRAVWNAQDEHGISVGEGTYVIKVSNGKLVESSNVVIVR